MKRITQKDMVLQHLIANKKITSWVAIKEYGCTRLADVIYKLKKEGYPISDKSLVSTNRFGHKVNFKEYTYFGEKSLN